MAGLAACLLLAACGGSGGDAGGKDGGQVVIGSFGGQYDDLQKQFALPVFAKEYASSSAPKVVFDSSDATTRDTKIKAQAAAKKGEFDVVMATSTDIPILTADKALLKLDYSKIPNSSHILPVLKNDYCIPHIYSPEVMIYNTDKIKTPPTSWNDFWDPALKGKIGVVSTIWQQWFFLASAAKAGGDPKNDWTLGNDLVKQLKGQVRVYGSQDALGQAMVTGEIWITENRMARTHDWNKAGATLASVLPKEGTVPYISYACIASNAPNPDAAYKYLNSLLDPAPQDKYASEMGYAPTVDNATLPADLAKELTVPADQESLVYPYPAEYAASVKNSSQEIWKQYVVAG